MYITCLSVRFCTCHSCDGLDSHTATLNIQSVASKSKFANTGAERNGTTALMKTGASTAKHDYNSKQHCNIAIPLRTLQRKRNVLSSTFGAPNRLAIATPLGLKASTCINIRVKSSQFTGWFQVLKSMHLSCSSIILEPGGGASVDGFLPSKPTLARPKKKRAGDCERALFSPCSHLSSVMVQNSHTCEGDMMKENNIRTSEANRKTS